MGNKNLWGDIPDSTGVKTPGTILKEQAFLLDKMTEGLLLGKVSRQQDGDSSILSLFVVAPLLNNYRYLIARVTHGIELYPVYIDSALGGPTITCPTEETFETELGKLLSSPDIHRVIVGLLAEVKSE